MFSALYHCRESFSPQEWSPYLTLTITLPQPSDLYVYPDMTGRLTPSIKYSFNRHPVKPLRHLFLFSSTELYLHYYHYLPSVPSFLFYIFIVLYLAFLLSLISLLFTYVLPSVCIILIPYTLLLLLSLLYSDYRLPPLIHGTCYSVSPSSPVPCSDIINVIFHVFYWLIYSCNSIPLSLIIFVMYVFLSPFLYQPSVL